jgi:hypothetical protein
MLEPLKRRMQGRDLGGQVVAHRSPGSRLRPRHRAPDCGLELLPPTATIAPNSSKLVRSDAPIYAFWVDGYSKCRAARGDTHGMPSADPIETTHRAAIEDMGTAGREVIGSDIGPDLRATQMCIKVGGCAVMRNYTISTPKPWHSPLGEAFGPSSPAGATSRSCGSTSRTGCPVPSATALHRADAVHEIQGLRARQVAPAPPSRRRCGVS